MLLSLFSATDDPTDHVSVVRLGSVQQRHGCVLLVRNTIQGTSGFITSTCYIANGTFLFSKPSYKGGSYFTVILEHIKNFYVIMPSRHHCSTYLLPEFETFLLLHMEIILVVIY